MSHSMLRLICPFGGRRLARGMHENAIATKVDDA
jgi:hypothetical protein